MNYKFLTLALDGVYLASLAAMRDVMQIANHIVSRQLVRLPPTALPTLPSFESYLVSIDGEPVTTACGLRLPVDGGIDDAPQASSIYLPAIFCGTDADVWMSDNAKSLARLLPWLMQQYGGGAILGAVATSNLLLAEAGLLQKMRVPMPWAMERFLHRRYPSITPEPYQEIARMENIYCAGNLSSSLALCIELVGSHTPATITGLLSQYIRPMELALETPDDPAHAEISNPLVVRAMTMIQQMFTQTIDYTKLASDLAVSQRTLIRHFNRDLDMTPQAYQQHLRLEVSKHLLAQTQLPIARVAEYMGYTSAAYFSRLFRQRLGISIQDYQERCRVARAKSHASGEPEPCAVNIASEVGNLGSGRRRRR